MTPTNLDQFSPRIDQDATIGGLLVRTDLRAGLSWDELDDQAAALWQQLTTSISNAVSSVSGSSSNTSSTAS
ncbi:hypothetical protein GC175_18440 [bacterium]|nr:hypothetical protein [bacterium]